MMNFKMSKILFITIIFCILQACTSAATKTNPIDASSSTKTSINIENISNDQSVIEGNKFYYPAGGLTLDLPNKWVITKLDDTSFRVGSNKAGTILDLKQKRHSSADRITYRVLKLRSNKKHIGGLVRPRLTVNVIDFSKDLKNKDKSKRWLANRYVDILERGLKKSTTKKYEFTREKYTKDFGNKEYFVLPADFKISGRSFFNNNYVTYNKDNIFIFSIFNQTTAGRESFEQLLETAVFN